MKCGNTSVRLGEWTVHPDEGVLRRGADARRLQPKVMDVLSRLLLAAGDVVSREQLLEDVWQGRAMSDEPLHRCIAELRAALGDDHNRPEYIETLPRRGYRLIAPVRTATTRGRHAWPAIVAGLLAAAALLVPPLLEFESAAAAPRLLVLPLENLSPIDGNDLLIDGLTEELINALANNRALQVLSRTTTFSFRHSRQAQADLLRRTRADYFIEGSARIVGDKLRITVQLVDAASDVHIFSEVHEQALGEAPATLAAVAARVSVAVGRSIPPVAGGDLARLSPAAYRDFVEARMLLHDGGVAAIAQALVRLERVTREQPEFADGHSHLAAASLENNLVPGNARIEAEAIARQLERALRLDPGNALAHAVLARREPLQHIVTEQRLRMALQTDPDLVPARTWLGELYMRTGEISRAREQFAYLLDLDPLAFLPDSWLMYADYLAGDRGAFEQVQDLPGWGLAQYRNALPLFNFAEAGDFDGVNGTLQLMWMHSGRISPRELERVAAGIVDPQARGDALRLVDEMRRREPSIPVYRAFQFYLLLQDAERAFGMYLDRDNPLDVAVLYDIWTPNAAFLRRHPRFIEFAAHYGLTAYWETTGGNDFCRREDDRWRCR